MTNMISLLLKYKKIIGIVGGLISVVVSLYGVTTYFETKGYNRAMIEFQSKASIKINKATNEAILKARKETEKAMTTQQLIFDNELRIAKDSRIVETKIQEVIKHVDRVKIKNECATVSDDIVKLLNETINTINGTN